MFFLHFEAGADDSRRRLDKIIRKFLPDTPLSAIYAYIRKSLIRLNGKKTSADVRVLEGDSIDIADFLINPLKNDPKPQTERKTNDSFPILADIFKNECIRVINKPYDISVQGGSGTAASIADIIQTEYEQSRPSNSLSFKPGPLHRLDRKTTGLLVCSQNLEGARWFSAAIQEHLITKTYMAIVQGHCRTEQLWTDRIKRSPEVKGSFRLSQTAADTSDTQGKTADTHAVPLAYGAHNGTPVTLMQFSIGSGRTHQIRLHSSAHGFPLLGDTAYGAHPINEEQNIYLHAWKLVFPEKNPVSLPRVLYAPISTNFQKMLKKCLLEWNYNAYNINNI